MSLIDKRVQYTISKEGTPKLFNGIVKDKIENLKEKESSTHTVTGYLIENCESLEVFPIASWRIKRIY